MKSSSYTLGPFDMELLRLLRGVRGWLRPMDLGGHDASRHSPTLARLARRGLVARRRRNTLSNILGHRGSFEYRITKEGRRISRPIPPARVPEFVRRHPLEQS